MQKPDWIHRAKSIMSEKRITQADLMPALGIKTRGGVGHYFTGRSKLSMEQFKAMADSLGVPLNYLLFGGKDSLKINSDKLEDLLLAVSNVIKKHNIELTAPEQAKLITHLYVEIPNNEKASEKNIYKLISIFK